MIEGRVYIPVKIAPKKGNLHKPIVTNKEGSITTFNFGNKTYIPLDVIPKVYRPVFKYKIVKAKSPTVFHKNVKPEKK